MPKLQIIYIYGRHKVNKKTFSFQELALYKEDNDKLSFIPIGRKELKDKTLSKFYNDNNKSYEISKRYLVDVEIIT